MIDFVYYNTQNSKIPKFFENFCILDTDFLDICYNIHDKEVKNLNKYLIFI